LATELLRRREKDPGLHNFRRPLAGVAAPSHVTHRFDPRVYAIPVADHDGLAAPDKSQIVTEAISEFPDIGLFHA
jgi:hypothetical protein